MQRPVETMTVRRAAAVCTGAIATTVLMTWPLAAGFGHLGRTSNSGDGRLSVWNVAWVAHALLTDPMHVFDANIFYPHRETLAYSEANLAAGAIALPVWWLTGNPHAAHNTAVLFAFSATVVTTWLLARRLVQDDGAAALSAVLFAFCPYVFSHTPHIQLLMIAGLPLSLFMVHRLVDAPSIARGATLGLALAAQALSCAYYGVFAALIVGYAACFFAWSRRLWRSTRYWIAIGVGAALSIALVLPFFHPYLHIQREAGFRRSLADAADYSAYLRSYLASGAHAHNWMLPLIRDWHHEVLFPGFVSLGLGLAGLAIAFRSPRQSAPVMTRDRETALFYASIALFAFWASLGPRAGLYTLFFQIIPVFSFLRAPGRMGVIVALVLALFAAFTVRELRRRAAGWRAAAIAACLCLLALAELNLLPFDWRPPAPVPVGYQVLARMPRGPVAEFPFFERRIDFHIHTVYMLNSTIHWQPLVNGYSDYIPPDFRELATTLASFPSRESFEAMRKYRVRYITIHRELYGRESATRIEGALHAYHRYLRPVADDGQMLVYEVRKWPK